MISYEPVFVGSACNNRCVDCPVEDRDRHVDFYQLTEAIEKLAHGENILLTGGEPLLYDDIVPLIVSARRHGARRIKLRTNGRVLSDWNAVGRLLEEGCRIFEVKLFGSTPDIHDTITRSRGSFEETMQGLANLGGAAESETFANALFVTTRIEVVGANLEDLVATMVLAASMGVDRVLLTRRGTDFDITEGAEVVSNVVRTASLNRTWSMIEGFPPCIIEGVERHISELLMPVLSPDEKPKSCRTCLCRDVCPGPPEDYVRVHGMNAFQPVTKAPYMDDVKQIIRTRSAHGKE